jgi:hypothetical protein
MVLTLLFWDEYMQENEVKVKGVTGGRKQKEGYLTLGIPT